jgi:general secretion pathway protein G
VLFGAFLASILVLAVAAVVLPSLRRAQVDRAKLDMQNVGLALKIHRKKTGRVPTTTEGLQFLLDAGFVDAMPLDPWGHPYGYVRSEDAVELRSLGADGEPGGTGDDEDLVLRVPHEQTQPDATLSKGVAP